MQTPATAGDDERPAAVVKVPATKSARKVFERYLDRDDVIESSLRLYCFFTAPIDVSAVK
jgi:hypothetical protein